MLPPKHTSQRYRNALVAAVTWFHGLPNVAETQVSPFGDALSFLDVEAPERAQKQKQPNLLLLFTFVCVYFFRTPDYNVFRSLQCLKPLEKKQTAST